MRIKDYLDEILNITAKHPFVVSQSISLEERPPDFSAWQRLTYRLTWYGNVNRIVTFYKTADGKCPIQEFLDSLPSKVAQKVTWVLRLLEDLDVVPSSYFKKLIGTEEIWECRIQFGSNAYRMFCFFADNSVVILTHGFIKKSQKTPKSEIEKAEAYRRDFLKRRSKHE